LNRRSSRKRNGTPVEHPTFFLALLAVTALITCGVFIFAHSSSSISSHAFRSQWPETSQSEEPAAAGALPGIPHISEAPRVFYPYSVVPGGVRTPEELREAGAHDLVVGEHYAGFDFRKARVVEVRHAELVYLSYRIGEQIYWTTKKVTLHSGEKLITDGRITARTRCGNQVSALPQKKASSQEPSIAQFDGPIGSSTRDPFPENFHSALESRPGPGWGAPGLGPAGLVALGPGGSSPLGGGYLPIGSPLVPGSGCSNRGGICGTGTGPGPGTPSVPVPEPGTFQLDLAEILAMLLAWMVASGRTRGSRFNK
jgi:hypothetical protein